MKQPLVSLLYLCMALSILFSFQACGGDDDTDPNPDTDPISGSRVGNFTMSESNMSLEGTVSYNDNDEVDTIEIVENNIVFNRLVCEYQSSGLSYNTYDRDGSTDLQLALQTEITFDENQNPILILTKDYINGNEIERIVSQSFSFINGNDLSTFKYELDTDVDQNVDRTISGYVNYENGKVQSVIERVVDPNVDSQDSLFFEYENDKLVRILRAELKNGQYYLDNKSELNCTNGLLTDADVEEYETDFDQSPPFTFPVSNFSRALYTYDDENKLTSEYIEELKVDYVYEDGVGNIKDLYFFIDYEVPHIYLLGIFPSIQ